MTRPFYPAQTDYVEKLNALWDHVGILWRGDWDAGAAYEVGDLARYGKDVWRRLVAGTTAGVPSADLTNWELFVEGGIDGIDGTNGTDGIDGTNGTNGLNGADGADGVDGVQPWTTPPVAWAATTAYTATAPANSVTYSGESYVCSTSHTSTGSFDATKWTKIAAKGSGDVSGPASAADGKVVLFDGTSGKLIKDSGLSLSGSNTGDETGSSVATLLHAASAKTTLVDADEVNGTNSASSWALIRTTWADVWTYIKSKADTFYAPKGAATASGLTLSTGKLLGRTTAGTGAIEEIELGAFVAAQTAKTTAVDADVFLGSDSAASNVAKKFTWANLKAAIALLYSVSGGSALIGFIQAGFGAVARTLQSKQRDIVSVEDFGAIGDGVTDDTVAIQLALNYIGTKAASTLMMGSKRTYLATNLVLPHLGDTQNEDTATIEGRGSQIKAAAGGSSAYLMASERWVDNSEYTSSPWILKDLILDAAGLKSNALVFTSYFGELHNCHVIRATADGMVLPSVGAGGQAMTGSQVNVSIYNSWIASNGGVGLSIIDPAANRITDWKLIDSFLCDNEGGNLYADNCAGAIIRGCHTYHHTVAAPAGTVDLRNTYSTQVSGNIFEGTQNSLACLNVTGGSHPAKFVGNDFWSRVTVNFSAACKVQQFIGNTFLETADLFHNYNGADRTIVSTGNTFKTDAPFAFVGAGRILARNDFSVDADRVFSGTQMSSGRTPGEAVNYFEFPASTSATLTNQSAGRQVFTAVLVADVTLGLPSAGDSWVGLAFRVVRGASATGAFHIDVGGLKWLVSASEWIDVEFDGANWRETASGTL